MSDKKNTIIETMDQLLDRFKTMVDLSNLDKRFSDYLIYDINELKKTIKTNGFIRKNFPDLFEYEVLPENQCQGLVIWAKEQGHNKFKGFVRYSELRSEFYLTMDDITYTSLNKAFNIQPV